MALVLPQNGEGDALAAIVGKAAAENLVLHLYTNDITPGETDTTATYTEATFTGYAAITLTPASWTVTEGDPGLAAYPQQAFTSSADQAPESVYGYYLTRVTSGRIAWAERFPAGPYVMANNGDNVKVTLNFTLD